MRSKIASEPFTKFSAKFLLSKLNKYKLSASKGADDSLSKGLLSRLIQLKKFEPPSFAEMSSSEWTTYLGRQLTRHQAKDFNLLGSVLPYETEGQFELHVEFGNGQSMKRGNIILTEDIMSKPKFSYKYNPSTKENLSLLMIDCDFPTVENISKSFLLWKIDNLGTEYEKESYPFLPPMPERGSGIHRIVAIILKNYNVHPTDRESLDLLNIEDNIISYNYFQTLWTKAVSEQMKQFNVSERIFGQFSVGPGQNHV